MSSLKTIPSLNGIRAVCILLVLGSHAKFAPGFPQVYTGLWNHLFNGALGVSIFFVLSGFLITHLLVKEKEKEQTISLSNFYIRRAIRIFPVYYCLLFVYLILQLSGIFYFSPFHWLTSLTYTKDFGYRNWEDSHLWSLAVEEQFYLIWPLIFKFAPRKKIILFAATIVAACPLVRLAAYVVGNATFLKFSLFSNIDCLMIGCLAAIYLPVLIKTMHNYRQITIRLLAVAGILLGWYLELNQVAEALVVPLQRTLTSLCAALLIISFGFFRGGVGFKILNTKLLTYIGILSYSIYIWQQMFFSSKLMPLSTQPYNLVFIVITAALSYHLIEKPFLRLKSRFVFQRQKAAVSVPAAAYVPVNTTGGSLS